MAFADSGKQRRLARLFRHSDGRAVILPIDDGLISGPGAWLSDLSKFFSNIGSNPPDGVLLFAGVLSRYWSALDAPAAIVNVTASTRGAAHTRKILCTDVGAAVAAGADLVAVHVNVTSQHEGDMLRTLSTTVREAEVFGVPVFAIMYPRCEGDGGEDNYQELRKADPDAYAQLVAHAARIGMELGADVIKTPYTGSPETFDRVVEVIHIQSPSSSPEDHSALSLAAVSAARGAVAAGVHAVSVSAATCSNEMTPLTNAATTSLSRTRRSIASFVIAKVGSLTHRTL